MSPNDNKRIKHSLRNLATAGLGQLLMVPLYIAERAIFIFCLNVDYLGINGLYSGILTILSLAELGVGPAIIFALYKPLAHNQTEEIKSLMLLYRKAYRIIGLTITALGLICLPFLQIIIDSDLSIFNLRVYFLLFLANTVVSYFLSYKTTLIDADQKNYITSMGNYFGQIVQIICQITVLLLWRDYYLYLGVSVVVTAIKFFLLSKKADSLYPFLRDKNVSRLRKDTRNAIFKNIKAMLFHKSGRVIINSIDAILITSLAGLTIMGKYSNYQFVIVGLVTTIDVIYGSFSASIGNLCAIESSEKVKDSFATLSFINSVLYGICTVILFVLFEPIISAWLGVQYCIGLPTVLIICTNFYLEGMKRMVLVFRDVMGLFWADKYGPFSEAILNLGLSIFLGKRFGINGILLGTTISMLLVTFWLEPYVVFRFGLEAPVVPFFANYLKETLATITIGAVTFIGTSAISIQQPVIALIIKTIICFSICLTGYYLIYHKSKKFEPILQIIKKTIQKRTTV